MDFARVEQMNTWFVYLFIFYSMINGQANEDGNCYSYDGRKLDEAKSVHKDHVSAV